MTEPEPHDILDAAVIALVLARHPAPMHVDELRRTFGPDDWASSVTVLVADGLAHREGALVIASRAAVRGDELRA